MNERKRVVEKKSWGIERKGRKTRQCMYVYSLPGPVQSGAVQLSRYLRYIVFAGPPDNQSCLPT